MVIAWTRVVRVEEDRSDLIWRVSMVVQRLGLHAPNAGGQFQSLVRELDPTMSQL